MVFSSITFLCIFLPAVFLLHLILPGIRAKNGMLLAASIIFYSYGEPVYVLLLIVSAGVNTVFGRLMETKKSKAILCASVCWNILLLICFKYAGFLAESVNQLPGISIPVPQIRLPIGISFFTFQAMSYVVDVYRGDTPAQKSFLKVLLYLSLFPQLIAGPIIKYHDLEPELEYRRQNAEDIAAGLRRFIAGLSKKVLLADVLAAAADAVFTAQPQMINSAGAWIGAIAYMLQIYFDFSGYSDMAIGMGRMFGFHFQENFAYPYCAGSIRQFWKRWHISLTGWFREYLYIPLGGNRKGLPRTIVNRMLVFLCTGIWHGANITFVWWGVYHGLCVLAETCYETWKTGRTQPEKRLDKHPDKNLNKKPDKNLGKNPDKNPGKNPDKNSNQPVIIFIRRIASHGLTLILVCVGFVFFRAETLEKGFFMVRQMFTGFHFETEALSFALQQCNPRFLAAAGAAVIACTPVKRKLEGRKLYEMIAYGASAAGLLLCIMSLAGSTYHPFIYFQF